MRSPLLCVLVLLAALGAARADPSIERGRAVAMGVPAKIIPNLIALRKAPSADATQATKP